MVPTTTCGVNPKTLVSNFALSSFALQPAFSERSNLLHSPSIDPKITVTGPRSRPKMDGLGFIIKDKLDIVHESKQQTRKFVVEVSLVLFHEFRARQIGHNAFEHVFGPCQSSLVSVRLNSMA